MLSFYNEVFSPPEHGYYEGYRTYVSTNHPNVKVSVIEKAYRDNHPANALILWIDNQPVLVQYLSEEKLDYYKVKFYASNLLINVLVKMYGLKKQEAPYHEMTYDIFDAHHVLDNTESHTPPIFDYKTCLLYS